MAYAAPKTPLPGTAAESPALTDRGVLHLGLNAIIPADPAPGALQGVAPAPPLPDFHPDFDEHPATGDAAVTEGADTPRDDSYDGVVRAVGSLVCSWGSLERTTMDKLTAMRLAAGDVRLVGGRMRPGMARLLAELRALVSMRDRHDKQALVVIAELENHIQRIAQFHLLVISGFQAAEGDVLLCRDSKNSERRISVADLEREIATIEMIKERLSAI